MSATKVLGLVLLLAGVLGLLYGGFTYTRDTHTAKLGPVELTVKEKDTVNIPVWAGVCAMLAGGALMIFSGKRS